MIFRFYLNDILIDEPVGFDATKVKLKRSENWHGVMSETDSQSVDIYGTGYTILKDLYDSYGIDAVAILRIEYACVDTFEVLGEYSITFYNSQWFCGNNCYCKVGIERKGCLYQLTNALDTKVDLDALKAIDKTTDLADYDYLGKEIEVPSKTIVLSSNAIVSEYITNDVLVDVNAQYGGTYTGVIQIAFFMPFDNIGLEELSEISTAISFEPNFGAISDDDIHSEYIYKNIVNNFQCLGDSYNISINTSGVLNLSTTATLFPISVTFFVYKLSGTTRTELYSQILINTGTPTDKIYEYNISYSDSVSLLEGDYIYSYIFVNALKTTSGNFDLFNISEFKDSEFNISLDSICPSTNAKLYLVNETLSHISEYVTNNCLRVYSEYLGRTDSQPYNQSSDGCGGMIGLTNGLFLRRIEDVYTGDKTPKLALSFNDVINAVNAVNPVGFAIELNGDDEVIRVENWEHFYNDMVVADIGSVTVKKSPNLKLHFKNFKTGYNKYEAEEYNGLDEFLTEREYTTSLVNHNATLDKVCQFVASGYAIEITRRKGNADSKDWRYDNDTFFICLKRLSGELVVEQGNIINNANIIDASTILNFTISPARMAMKWFKYITTFLKSTKELIYSSGKGNTAAEGELINVCSIESGVISEKQNITQSDFQTSEDGIYLAELHGVDEVPFTFEQYKSVKLNPHGLIAYNCDAVQKYGWIQEFEYSFVDGKASFILIPKV